MSYSTALYAVDLERLRAAIGSRDQGIVDLIKRKYLNRNIPVRGRVLRVEVADDDSVRLDGRPASIDDFVRAMQELTQPGDNIRFHPCQSESGTKLRQTMMHTWQAMYASASLGPMLYSCAKEQVCPYNKISRAAHPRSADRGTLSNRNAPSDPLTLLRHVHENAPETPEVASCRVATMLN